MNLWRGGIDIGGSGLGMDMGYRTRRLHGVRMTEEELAEVCRECGVSAVGYG